jgi:hypothetical protein
MQIFEQEFKDGLAEQIAKSSSIAFELIPTKSDDTIKKELIDGFSEMPDLADAVKKVDLFYFESVLASVGWNLNDDIFDPYELFAARNTPVDKKINYMHDEADIIGHMKISRAVDLNGKLILNTQKDIPTNFDVVVGGFLYKYWEDKTRADRINQIIDSIGKREIAVSMECIFPNFDYGVITPDGQHKIIARAENTSFLTKHLRRYGGNGEYQGNKVGRLLRSMVFTGNALVNKPANPRSLIIRSEGNKFLGSIATISIFNKIGDKIMADVTLTQDKYDLLVKRAEAADAAAKETLEKNLVDHKAQAKTLQDGNDKLTSDLTKAQEALKKVTDELTAAQAISKANEDKSTTLVGQIKELETRLVEAKAAMDKKSKEDKMAARKVACVALDMDETKANEFLAKFADIADELFDEVVKAMPKRISQTNKDVLAGAQLTTATVNVNSDTQKLLSAKASEWITGSLTLETKTK